MAIHTENGFVVSEGNVKMGKVYSFSVNPGETCPDDAPCKKRCYAKRMTRYKGVRNTYDTNTCLLKGGSYSNLIGDISELIQKKGIKYFRWNVSGDFFSKEYLYSAINVAILCPDTRFWAFTKQWGVLRDVLDAFDKDETELPPNFNLVLSSWGDYQPPEDLKQRFGVNYFGDKNGLYAVPPDAFVCEGGCETCLHCSVIKGGQSMVIHEH